MIWFALYVAAMFCIALPVALFARNEVAAVVFAVWGVGQVTYQIGLPEAPTQVVLYMIALAISMRIARTAVCLFAALLFFPLALASVSHAVGWLDTATAWWSIYWVAVTQVLSLPFCVDWPWLVRRWRGNPEHGGGSDMLRVQHT